MTIRVLRRHIEAGEKSRCYKCPIALAVKERTGQAWRIAETDAEKGSRFVRLPKSAIRFMAKFDDGKPTKPFTFTINL